MLQWLKDALKDSYTDEIDKAVAAHIGKEFVSRTDFNAVNTEKKTAVEQVAARDKQLDTLTKTAGDSDALKGEITKLQGENKIAQTKWEADVKQIKLDSKLDTLLIQHGAVNTKAVRALLDSTKISLDGDNLVGIDDQLKGLKETEKWAFTSGGSSTPPAGHTGIPQGSSASKLSGVEESFYKINPELAPK